MTSEPAVPAEPLDDDLAKTTHAAVVMRLRNEILRGQLAYGTRLRQADVARRFNISTTPVREAFRELATLGLVEVFPHRGAVVIQPSGDELADIYQVRTLLEPVCTAWSAQNISELELDRSEAVLHLMEKPNASSLIPELNREFHSIFARGSGNKRMSEVVINMMDLSTPYIALLYGSGGERFKHQAQEHREILEACRERNSERAYAASLRHLSALKLPDGSGTGVATFEKRWLPVQLRAPFAHPSLTAPARSRAGKPARPTIREA
jgi:DNA-binding GntR family transcriptional regulator